jgi:TrmH RNA methyltransferase
MKFYGVQACLALFEHRPAEVSRVFIMQEQVERFAGVLDWCVKRSVPSKVVSFDELSRVASTEHHEGVCFEAAALQSVSIDALIARVAKSDSACVLLLEGVENPHNVGAIIRTACFFGTAGIILVSSQSSSLSGAACRVAEGGAEVVPVAIVREGAQVLAAIKKAGFKVFATTPHEARSLYEVRWPKKAAILFGAEGSGLTLEALKSADERVVIPRVGPLESLNVAASVAAVLTEVRRF